MFIWAFYKLIGEKNSIAAIFLLTNVFAVLIKNKKILFYLLALAKPIITDEEFEETKSTLGLDKRSFNLLAIQELKQDFSQKNVLMYAQTGQHWDVINYLIKQGARSIDGMPPSVEYRTKAGILSDITMLARLICETNQPSDCKVSFNGQQVTFKFKICNNSNLEGIHHAQVPIIPHALGSHYFDEKNSHQFESLKTKEQLTRYSITLGEATQENTAHDHDCFNNLEEIRDRLLKREIETILACAQNAKYKQEYGQPHPLTGKGATKSANLLKRKKFIGYEITQVKTNNDSITIEIVNHDKDDHRDEIANALATILQINSEKIIYETNQIILHFPSHALIKRMQKKRVNYLGVVVVNRKGQIALAERKNFWEEKSRGFNCQGGHCNEPYLPELAVLETLEEESGFKLKNPTLSPERCVKMIKDDEDGSAIGIINFDDLQLTEAAAQYAEERKLPFQAEATEFVPGTEGFFSLKDMRERQLPLSPIFVFKTLELLSQGIQGLLDSIKELSGLKIDILKNIKNENEKTIPTESFGHIKCWMIDNKWPYEEMILFKILLKKLTVNSQVISDNNLPRFKMIFEPFLLYTLLHEDIKTIDFVALFTPKNATPEKPPVQLTNFEPTTYKTYGFWEEKNHPETSPLLSEASPSPKKEQESDKPQPICCPCTLS